MPEVSSHRLSTYDPGVQRFYSRSRRSGSHQHQYHKRCLVSGVAESSHPSSFLSQTALVVSGPGRPVPFNRSPDRAGLSCVPRDHHRCSLTSDLLKSIQCTLVECSEASPFPIFLSLSLSLLLTYWFPLTTDSHTQLRLRHLSLSVGYVLLIVDSLVFWLVSNFVLCS